MQRGSPLSSALVDAGDHFDVAALVAPRARLGGLSAYSEALHSLVLRISQDGAVLLRAGWVIEQLRAGESPRHQPIDFPTHERLRHAIDAIGGAPDSLRGRWGKGRASTKPLAPSTIGGGVWGGRVWLGWWKVVEGWWKGWWKG